MALLVVMMLIGAVLEVAGLGMLVEAVSIVMDEKAVETNKYATILYDILPVSDGREFTIAVLVTLMILFVLKNVFLYVQQKFLLSFVYTNQFATSERLMKNYLRKNYEFYLNADTAVVQRNITSDVNNMYALILALLTLLSEGIVFVFLAAVLFLADPKMTLVITGVLIILLIVIKLWLKPIMNKAGKDNQDFYSNLYKLISQSIQGIKEMKIGRKEQFFVDEYVVCGKGYVNAVQKYTLYNAIPRLLIESVLVICMVSYLLYMILSGNNAVSMAATFTAFAAAAVRLLPSANRINNQLNTISYCEPFFLNVADSLDDELKNMETNFSFNEEDVVRLPVMEKVELKDITYAYPNTEKLIFDKAEMEIPIGKAVGIVGTTGAGKTTIVDVLLGLLNLKGGEILADGVNTNTNYKGWLKNIGYIPQMIFMLDSNIRENVAFGVNRREIDEDRVWEALREAQLDDFVRSLPDGLNTSIGERGIRLSGGQRQRISIARALYNDPEVLILDEATSALDNDTEKAIMDSDVGITPENNGEMIRLTIPQPTEERRRDLVKQCNKIAEKAKVEVRNVRSDIKDKLKKAIKDGLSEDNEKDAELELQKIHDKYIKKVDELIAAKNKEIMTV